MIGRGVAYRKTEETDLLRSKCGSCSSGGGGVPQNGTPRDTGYLHRRPPPASTGSCSSSLHRALLHRLLFNHPSTGTPPPSTVHPSLHTTGSCSTTPPRPPLHCLLFIQPSTGWSYSSSPPRGPVQPAPTGSIDWGSVHPEATPRGPVHPPPPGTVFFEGSTGNCSSKPSSNAHCSSRGSIDQL